MQWIFWYDWLLLPVYFFILVKIFFSFANKRYTGNKLKYFKYGFIAKLIGALGFGFYHQYIYQGGDTFLYFDTALKLDGYISTDLHRFLVSVFTYSDKMRDLRFESLDDVVFNTSNFFVVRVAAVFALFAFKAYIPTLLMFAAVSYIGIWYAYTSVCKIYPLLSKELALVFLFIPSVVLWGSGLGKDSLTLGSTCLMFGAFLRLFLIPKPKRMRNLFFIIAGGFIVLMIKPYIIYSFVLSFIVGILFEKIRLIKNPGTKMLVAPLLLGLGLLAGVLAFNYISNDPNFALDLIADKVVRSSKNLGEASGAGSAYDLGMNLENINGLADILPVFPKSIFVTLFRPFLWEVSNPAMLLSALESFAFFMIFIYIILKRKIFGIIPTFARNPITISCLLYTLIFAGLVGISSGNFGTLVRYKIPCLPFFGMMLCILNAKRTDNKIKEEVIYSSEGKTPV